MTVAAGHAGAAMPAGPTLRLAAVGAVSGALAGLFFGVCALLIQTAITQDLISRYGNAAVDHGAAFLSPGLIPGMSALGAAFGIVYVAAWQFVPWPIRVGGILFAALLTLVLQPLLASGLDYFSAVVMVSVTGPNGLPDKCCTVTDVAPPRTLGLLMSALIFLEGLAIHRFAHVGLRLMPRLPAAVYAVITVLLGFPGVAFIGLLLLIATGVLGGE